MESEEIPPSDQSQQLPAKPRRRLSSWMENLENELDHVRRSQPLTRLVRRGSKVEEAFAKKSTSSSAKETTIEEVPELVLSPKEKSISESEELTSQEGRVRSPTLSQSSKKTSSSVEMKANMRSKIRKQAQKAVLRTRGSVQLTRRLQRSQTVTITETGPSPRDLDAVDEQIERSLEIGARFMTEEQKSDVPSDDVQYRFMTAEYRTPPTVAEDHPLQYTKARVAAPPPSSLTQILPTRAQNDVESGLTPRISFFTTRPPVDTSRLEQRLSRIFFNAEGQLRHEANRINHQPLKTERDEESGCVYTKPVDWRETVASFEGSRLVQLDIELSRIVFHHHWLFSKEDALASELRQMHEEQGVQAERLVRLMETIVDKKRQLSGSPTSELDELLGEWQKGQEIMTKTGELIRQKYDQLQELRREQKFTLTPLKLDIEELAEENESLGEVFVLSEKATVSTELPKDEQERLASLHKCHVEVMIHFNGIPVYKTKAQTIDRNFSVVFAEIYNLEIYDVPESITLTITEKFGRLESREIATVGIPLPDENSFTDPDIPPTGVHFASDLFFQGLRNSLGAGGREQPNISGNVFCRASWAKKGHLKLKFDEQKRMSRRASRAERSFELIPAEIRLVSDEEFASELRFDVLAMRHARKLAKSADLNRIPMTSAEIDPHVLLMDDRKLTGDIGYRTGLEGHRIAANKYAALIRTQLLDRYSGGERRKNYQDVVREEPLPSMFAAFGSLCGPPDVSRKLKPMRRPMQRMQKMTGVDCRLVVNVQSALNLPARSDDSSLQPLVEIRFRDEVVRTSVVSGRNANWQQTLLLNLPSFSDSNTDLHTITDNIQFDLYDQLVTSLDSDNREVNSLHEQLIRRWLGGLRVPFSTVFCNGKIDGLLRVRAPLFATDYKSADKPSYLKVLVATEPAILPPTTTPPVLNGSVESDSLLERCMAWEKWCSRAFENRRFVALVSDVNGKKLLASRYLRPIRPPPHLERFSGRGRSALEAACYIVSLVPFVSDPVLFPGTTDVWTTVDQFAQLGCGDEEEHAVLLACWLLHMGFEAKIVLGSALPEGPKAAFVLATSVDEQLLLNPSDGNVYSVEDSLCPLVSVATVISSRNIYGNIQPHAHPSHISYDFKKTSDWKALFDKEPEDLKSVQPESIAYSETNEDAVVELRASLERTIKMRFDELRQFGIPQWNLLASRAFRELLVDLESGAEVDVERKISQLRDSYHVHAVAFRHKFQREEEVVEDVLRTNLHINSDPNVQFALAVHVQPFFNHIVSCSVALASLSLKI